MLATTIATTALTTTAAHAFQPGVVPPCSFIVFMGCGQPTPPADPARARNRDTSPDYMKQSDPRYNQALMNGGGSGGGGGGGGGGGR